MVFTSSVKHCHITSQPFYFYSSTISNIFPHTLGFMDYFYGRVFAYIINIF